jgi:molybdopterin-biosynthesis enzyme MoeA-like protein
MFSFGGIGSTPDDLTREVAAEVFTKTSVVTHAKFKEDIIERFGQEAYPHRIHMADIPEGATLLANPVNNMSGFALENRYYFVPGFPSMAHPMIQNVIKDNYSQSKEKFRSTLFAHTSENTLISLMKSVPKEIELSSLPMFIENEPHVELSLISDDEKLVKKYFKMFKKELDKKNIYYKLI